MKLIQSLAPVLAQGVQVMLKLSANGEQVQLDILPTGKENKAGIVIPPKTILGTAQEIDEGLEDFMAKYCQSAGRIVSIANSADADLQAAEKEAADKAKQALDEKRKTKTSTPSKPAASTLKKDRTAGLAADDDENGDDNDDESGGDGPGSGTTLDTSGTAKPAEVPLASTAAPAASAPAQQLAALGAELF
jgi:PRTRC genetic system protein E